MPCRCVPGRRGGSESAKFPVNFPVIREFGLETGPIRTASCVPSDLEFACLDQWRGPRAGPPVLAQKSIDGNWAATKACRLADLTPRNVRNDGGDRPPPGRR